MTDVTSYLKQYERGRGPHIPRGIATSVKFEPSELEQFRKFIQAHDGEMSTFLRAAAHYFVQQMTSVQTEKTDQFNR